MAALLAGLAGFIWGIADFLGGLATKKSPALWTTLIAAAVGLGIGVISSPFFGPFLLNDVGWGVAAGVGGAFALVLLYYGLGEGPVGVVAPISSVLAALVPFLVGIALGERPSTQAILGSVLAVIAILMITVERIETRAPTNVLLAAVGAGIGFGLFFVFISFATADSGIWPLVGSKGANVVLVGIALIIRRGKVAKPAAIATALGAGILDMISNILVLIALRTGLLSLVAVLSSLYPISTMILARFLFHERFRKVQLAGIALALVATALIASG